MPVTPVNIVSLDTTVSQSEQSVNSSISEKAENDTENRKFSVSEEQKTDYGEVMDELLQKYERNGGSAVEYYINWVKKK